MQEWRLQPQRMPSARTMRGIGRAVAGALVAGFMLTAVAPPVRGAGSDEQPLVGIGVVIGLPGTGDSFLDPDIIDASIIGILKGAGLEPWRDQIKPRHVAIVMLSAALPSGAAQGAKIDVTISPIGDSRSLAGGTLLVTPLRDGAGIVQAIGQGRIAPETARPDTLPDSGKSIGARHVQLAQGAVIYRHRTVEQQASIAP